MANISTLSVNLVAKTATFEKGMRKGRMATSRFKASAQALKSVMAKLMGIFVAIQSVRAITGYISSMMQAIDVTAKLSRRLGIVIKDLIVLQHAAQIMGVSQEALNKSLDMFTRRMGEMSTGTGEALRGFELLGMEYEEFIGLDPMAAFKKIADKISTMTDKTIKAAAAYFMFGRAGAQLVNLLEQGSAGIVEFEQIVEKLGITFDKFDAAKVEAANDAITDMKAAVKALGQEITIGLAPALERIANATTGMITEQNKLLKVLRILYAPTGFAQAEFLTKALIGTGLSSKVKIKDAFTSVEDMETAMDALGKTTDKVEKVTLRWKSSYLAAADAVTELVKTPLERFADRMEFLDGVVNKSLITWEAYERAVELAKKELEELTKVKLDPDKLRAEIDISDIRKKLGGGLTTPGEFESVRPAFVDPFATGGFFNPLAAKMDKSNELNEQQLKELKDANMMRREGEF
jgi:hypothetical protein